MKKNTALPIILIAYSLCFFLSCSQNSTTGPEQRLSREFQKALDNSLELHDALGISAAVLMPDQDVWVGTSGISHEDVPLDVDMLFYIASVTKTFVAACILQLVEEGELILEDSLYHWFPAIPNIDSTITIRQLLNHTSGVFDYYYNPAYEDSLTANLNRRWMPEEILTLVAEPYFPPGTDYHYSNTNYILLGMIIQDATGNEVSAEIRNRFLNPLGLSQTFFEVEETIPGELVHGWADVDDDPEADDMTDYPLTAFFSLEWTAGAMVSTPDDIVRWASALFTGDVLSAATLSQMLTFYPYSMEGQAGNGYGLGVSRFKPEIVRGEQAYGHGGTVYGYRNVMIYLPDYGVSISVMINEMNPNSLWGTLEALIDVVLDYVD
ncbi:MAG: beta-lactamase family protein [Fidelibacterota bacterium]|nr:MAG: beta-lactamase family protein [Candidatus Neomarinimicrobiota bacterium]